jgi:DNA-3-methyladenine glycosylase
MAEPLPRDFYARSAVELAPDLLGKRLVRELDGVLLAGRIVEVEAYLGGEDAASHAFRGPTPRNRSMFGPPGHAYVYLIYGVHHCLNIVTGPEGDGQAVLIRALEPLAGVNVMRANRGNVADRDLTNGPGKLCQALGIDKRLDGHDLCLRETLWLEDAPLPEEPICAGPRVGVRGDEAALARPWRYFLKDSPFVSRTPLNRACDSIKLAASAGDSASE